MAAYAAFLKGMNLGRRRISNQELASAFEALGFLEVQTFRASGNVAFTDALSPPQELVGVIEAGLAERLGYAVPTFVRTAAQVRAIAGHAPFERDVGPEGGKLQVVLLTRDPSAQARAAVLAMGDAHDRLAILAGELYWLPSGSTTESALDLKALERLLGPMTVRTKGTIELMAARVFAA